MRFIGSAQMDKPPLGPIFKAYNNKYQMPEGPNQSYPMELPGEIYSYVAYLATTTPPSPATTCSGSASWACCCGPAAGSPATPPWWGRPSPGPLLANTWVLPLQALAIMMWAALNWRGLAEDRARRSPWAPPSSGWPPGSTCPPSPPPPPATRPRSGTCRGSSARRPCCSSSLLLPTIAYIVLGFLSGNPQGRRLAFLWLFLLLFTEFFYVDDEYTGHYDRFNTTLKWWPWVIAGTLMTLAPIVLEQAEAPLGADRRVPLLRLPLLYAYDLFLPMYWGPKDSRGKIEGTYY